MGRRDDFYKILNHETPERLLIDLGGNPLSSMEGKSMYMLLDFLGYDNHEPGDMLLFGKTRRIDERLLTHFDIDTRSVGTILFPQSSQFQKISDREYIDEWGIRRIYTGMYWDIVESPLKGATIADLDNFQWPDPASIDDREIEIYTGQAKKLREDTDYVICAEHPVYGIFELGCWMCGFEDFLMKMALEQDFVRYFFDKILDYQKQVIERYYGALGQYIHYTSSGDDFATQENLFFSTQMFKDLIKPCFKERIRYTKQFTKAAFLHHSCGSVFDLIDDLIDCGVEILNPIQPKAGNMSPANLKKTYGANIVFHGGIDTQDILPFGTKENIEASVHNTIEIMNQNGGYIFAAAHNIQEDIPPQNVVYMFEAARAFEV